MPIEYLATADDELIRGRARIGDAEIIVCTDGTCRFDGGAMFGVVPKTLWSKKSQPDELNRVTIGLNCVVVRMGGKTLLIETGFGNKIAPKLKEIYATQERLPASLAAAGIAPAEIDFVLNTHLHWDHCGWNSVLDESGTAVPFFPNAQYIAHSGEVEHGRRQWERDRISYVADNYEPMIRNGQMRLIEGTEAEIMPGVRVECFPGHTAQLMAVHIESGGDHACFISDLLPTTAHLDVGWAMGFDLDPLRTIEERKRFYAKAVPEQWLVLFPHDHHLPMSHVVLNGQGRFNAINNSPHSLVTAFHESSERPGK
jgi:glyoxylase-like metal-dependent hydrolase (beta-lactamase superfamily II)